MTAHTSHPRRNINCVRIEHWLSLVQSSHHQSVTIVFFHADRDLSCSLLQLSRSLDFWWLLLCSVISMPQNHSINDSDPLLQYYGATRTTWVSFGLDPTHLKNGTASGFPNLAIQSNAGGNSNSGLLLKFVLPASESPSPLWAYYFDARRSSHSGRHRLLHEMSCTFTFDSPPGSDRHHRV
jgi:hypothetical protein